jgi:hypothetical protein
VASVCACALTLRNMAAGAGARTRPRTSPRTSSTLSITTIIALGFMVHKASGMLDTISNITHIVNIDNLDNLDTSRLTTGVSHRRSALLQPTARRSFPSGKLPTPTSPPTSHSSQSNRQPKFQSSTALQHPLRWQRHRLARLSPPAPQPKRAAASGQKLTVQLDQPPSAQP